MSLIAAPCSRCYSRLTYPPSGGCGSATPQGMLMVWDFSRPDVAASLAEALNRVR